MASLHIVKDNHSDGAKLVINSSSLQRVRGSVIVPDWM